MIEKEITVYIPVTNRGVPPRDAFHEIVNPILFKLTTGVQRAYLPAGSLFADVGLSWQSVNHHGIKEQRRNRAEQSRKFGYHFLEHVNTEFSQDTSLNFKDITEAFRTCNKSGQLDKVMPPLFGYTFPFQILMSFHGPILNVTFFCYTRSLSMGKSRLRLPMAVDNPAYMPIRPLGS